MLFCSCSLRQNCFNLQDLHAWLHECETQNVETWRRQNIFLQTFNLWPKLLWKKVGHVLLWGNITTHRVWSCDTRKTVNRRMFLFTWKHQKLHISFIFWVISKDFRFVTQWLFFFNSYFTPTPWFSVCGFSVYQVMRLKFSGFSLLGIIRWLKLINQIHSNQLLIHL